MMLAPKVLRGSMAAGLIVLMSACGSGGSGGGDEAASAAPTPDASGKCEIVVNDDGSLEPLSDGFPNDDFTIVSADEPGSPDGLYALQLKTAIEDEGLTGQRVTVVDRPDLGQSSGAWEALTFITEQKGGDQGYVMAIGTAPGSTTDLLQTNVMSDKGYKVESMNVVLATEFIPYVLVSRKDAPWGKDVNAFIKYAQEHPNELKYISRGPGAGLDLAFNNYAQVAAKRDGLPAGQNGIPVEVVIGGSHQEINAVVGSGEGDVANTVMDAATQFYADGRIEVLMVGGNGEPPDEFPGVPTARQLFGDEALANDPWGVNRFLFVPESVPECHRQWLTTMFEQAIENPEYLASRSNIPGFTPLAMSREDTWELANVAYGTACEILKPMDLVDESVTAAGKC